jgi:hypothetical protein
MALCVRASAVKPQVAKAQARKAPVVQKVAQAAAVGISSLALALSAHADATVKLGADRQALSAAIDAVFGISRPERRPDACSCPLLPLFPLHSGALVFEPASVTIKAGETVTWVNNAGYPHNIVFDEDAIPVSGQDALLRQQSGAAIARYPCIWGGAREACDVFCSYERRCLWR